MKCPCRKRQIPSDNIGYDEDFLDCLKENCACFIGDEDICVIVATFGVLAHILRALETIAKELTLLHK